MSYLVKKAAARPVLSAGYESEDWKNVPTMKINNHFPEGTGYRPQVEFKLQYTDEGLFGLFRVADCFIRCENTEFQSSVCQDSCMEFFVRPASGVGYENFEINASGTMLVMQIANPGKVQHGVLKFRYLAEEEIEGIEIYHSLPDKVLPELQQPTVYYLGWFIPFAFFKRLNGSPVPVKGTMWRANAFKCGDYTSQPHWLSWQPLQILNFHQPDCFGQLIFD